MSAAPAPAEPDDRHRVTYLTSADRHGPVGHSSQAGLARRPGPLACAAQHSCPVTNPSSRRRRRARQVAHARRRLSPDNTTRLRPPRRRQHWARPETPHSSGTPGQRPDTPALRTGRPRALAGAGTEFGSTCPVGTRAPFVSAQPKSGCARHT